MAAWWRASPPAGRNHRTRCGQSSIRVRSPQLEDEMWGGIKDRIKSEPNKVSLDKYRKVTPESLGLAGKSRIALVVGQGDIVRGSSSDDGSEDALTSYGFTRL